ncbi:PREDICTED: NADH dehydrogenase [ubiquinone] 1 alpha subcomplex subunit 7-like isoform X2 [Priapulus caudatus]|uniref:NADH dehydrogenase [ubiquinone] 1 alpha subcomplex subunit 7 n=1 Tax=Priapulus caudatus TaxID=37621 RepID=A0ABM1DVH8_PRICU|nr:PREDICTED: NADH dehydrogenase [ubiquinone] 1 alpha subcomplex subunit 7-like isoform X2 [Priapulus caudatus]
MATKVKTRNVTPIIAWVRDFLLGRPYTQALRFKDWIVPRDQPAPVLPLGITHKLSDNYYHTRDGRGESRPNTTVYSSSQKTLMSGDAPPSNRKSVPTPGNLHHWD